MCDDWYRSPFDGACFGVLEASRLRPLTSSSRYVAAPAKKVRRGKVHEQYRGKSLCGVPGRISFNLDEVTCKRCLKGLKEPF